MIASLTQHTSLKPKDILDLTVYELEALFEGFEENSDDDEKPKKPLEGKDAVNALRSMGFLT